VRGALAAAGVLMTFAAAWELAGALEGHRRWRPGRIAARALGERSQPSLGPLARIEIEARIGRAGLEGRLGAGAVLAAKLALAGVGALTGAAVAPAAPGRLAIPLFVLMLAAGFVVPDALLERAGRRRRARFIAALPDALDILAVGAAAGHTPSSALAGITAGVGPLAQELAGTVAAIECGSAPGTVFDDLRRRVPGPEVGALVAALERSRNHGSPLAEQLHHQAGGLRRDARRRIEERAARAAPKIQLVVALVLVPSVLLTILATIVAHSDALFGAF
jgi:tight adherence protein C